MSDLSIFVYGTLRRGGSNDFRMAAGRCLDAATVRGRLYRVDWYPGLVLDAAAGEVRGDLFEVPASTMADLDAFEGEEYRRVETEVRLENGTSRTAWIWEWAQSTEGLSLIANGDWLEGQDPRSEL